MMLRILLYFHEPVVGFDPLLKRCIKEEIREKGICLCQLHKSAKLVRNERCLYVVLEYRKGERLRKGYSGNWEFIVGRILVPRRTRTHLSL